MRTVMAPFFWFGRVSLWVLFFPLGLWRTVRHGRKKSERRQALAFKDALEYDREQRRKQGIG